MTASGAATPRPLKRVSVWSSSPPPTPGASPRLVRDWLLRTELTGAKQAWFVMTCGSEIGRADHYNRQLCAGKGPDLHGHGPDGDAGELHCHVRRASGGGGPAHRGAVQSRTSTAPSLPSAAGQPFSPTRDNLYDRFMSGPVNPIFYAALRQGGALHRQRMPAPAAASASGDVPPTTSLCGTGKPVWGKDCTHCMACICYCPAEAIEYGKKSLGKPRYHFEVL